MPISHSRVPSSVTSKTRGKAAVATAGNHRRNAARELERFAEWGGGDGGDDNWTGIVPDDVDREPTFDDLDERDFREYARHLAGDRGLKQNIVQTYYRYISAWCGWCVNEGLSRGPLRAAGECDGTAPRGRRPRARRPAGVNVRAASRACPSRRRASPRCHREVHDTLGGF